MKSHPFIHVDAELRNAVEADVIAGAVLIAAGGAGRRHEFAVSRAQITPLERPLSSSTSFDLASLTKVLATTCWP